jgi:hypothetical protein
MSPRKQASTQGRLGAAPLAVQFANVQVNPRKQTGSEAQAVVPLQF